MGDIGHLQLTSHLITKLQYVFLAVEVATTNLLSKLSLCMGGEN